MSDFILSTLCTPGTCSDILFSPWLFIVISFVPDLSSLRSMLFVESSITPLSKDFVYDSVKEIRRCGDVPVKSTFLLNALTRARSAGSPRCKTTVRFFTYSLSYGIFSLCRKS
ncbi:hypothetical protein ANAPH2_01425 [Anaplasma phagocytophilum]|nr:hypothetical protein ANAPH2_01425 [Anaplasma phagocytophilum]